MGRYLFMLLIILLVQAQLGTAASSDISKDGFCTQEWYRLIEKKVATGDGQGHGPDLGSGEWQSVVEFKLGIRGKVDVPQRKSDAWCRYIDQIVRSSHQGNAEIGKKPILKKGAAPSFACGVVLPGSIEALICADAELAALDRKLAEVFTAASKKAINERPPLLKAQQRGWIKGRNDCWKSNNQRDCVQEAYSRRIVELQARYRLVPFNGPVRFVCDNNPAND